MTPPSLRNHPDDLFALSGLVASARGLDPALVEKDFWVTELLRSLARPGTSAGASTTVIFKGGTSLSKAFGLIERFSEDVDVLLVAEGAHGKKAMNRTLKSLCERAASHLGIALDACTVESVTAGIKRNVRYPYPRRYSSGLISEGVLLEIGSRGGAHPHTRRSIRSLVAEHAVDVLGEPPDAWEELAAFELSVLSPERTLIEKLSLLHDCATRVADQDASHRLDRAGRHYYDVYRLLCDDRVRAGLGTIAGGVAALAADIDEHSDRAGFSFTPRPAQGFGVSPAFALGSKSEERARDAYEAAKRLIWGSVPEFQECLAAVRAHAALL